MIPFSKLPKWSQIAYRRLASPSSDHFESEDRHNEQHNGSHCVSHTTLQLAGHDFKGKIISFVLAGLLCLSAGVLLGYTGSRNNPAVAKEAEVKDYCTNAPSRREWSRLSLFEKSDFITSVRRMAYEKSQVRPEGALYDDFPYIRAEHGAHSINAASFLPWNRYFLHTYEKTLKECCHFKGTLPYWSWSLHWESLIDHPVFAKSMGFGGNGISTGLVGPGGGHTVVDGSFSDLQLKIVDGLNGSAYSEHYLSRRFTDSDLHGQLAGSKVSPDIIREILDQPNFESFFAKLQSGPMAVLPAWINGDFGQLTGPNDPLFILHLTQVDRLWWLWQMIDPYNRNEEYVGNSQHGSRKNASLSDIISLGGYIAPDVDVETVMATNYGGVLCYNYTLH